MPLDAVLLTWGEKMFERDGPQGKFSEEEQHPGLSEDETFLGREIKKLTDCSQCTPQPTLAPASP